jgi:dipeptidyl aminopeptidase/acylaminoacyl peptidase
MNTDELLKRGLMQRAAGNADGFLEQIVGAVGAAPQRRALPWHVPARPRWLLAFALLALLVAALAGAIAIGSRPPKPSPPSGPMSRYHHNGSILVMSGGQPVQLVAIGAGAPATPVELPAVDGVGRISWSPDGMQFAYSLPDAVRPDAVWIADLATGSTRSIFECAPSLGRCIPAWSPDGTEIAVSRGAYVLLLTPDGATIATLSLTAGPIAALVWAPDGSRLAIATNGFAVGATSTVYVVNRDGTRLHPLIDAAAPRTAIFDLAWAPDGTRIDFINTSTWDDKSGWKLTLAGIDPDGTHRADIADAGGCFCLGLNPSGLAWSPDGTIIALGKPGDGLFLLRPDGSDIGQVSSHWENPAWRPVP